MATLAQVRDGLRDRVAGITGLRAFGYMHPKPPAPALCVSGPKEGTTYDADFDGDWVALFDVWLFVDPVDLYRAQAALDAYLDVTGAKSVPASLRADPGLEGLGVSCRVTGVSQSPRLVETSGGQLLGAALALEVFIA